MRQWVCLFPWLELWIWSWEYRWVFCKFLSVFVVLQWGILEENRSHSSSSWKELYCWAIIEWSWLCSSCLWTKRIGVLVRSSWLISICQVGRYFGMRGTSSQVIGTLLLDLGLPSWDLTEKCSSFVANCWIWLFLVEARWKEIACYPQLLSQSAIDCLGLNRVVKERERRIE